MYTTHASQVIGLWEITWEGESRGPLADIEITEKSKAKNGVTKPIYE
jgi:hypothetical protein